MHSFWDITTCLVYMIAYDLEQVHGICYRILKCGLYHFLEPTISLWNMACNLEQSFWLNTVVRLVPDAWHSVVINFT